MTMDKPLTESLARSFADHLRDHLDTKEFNEAIRLNEADPDSASGKVCHSHDFCDANMVMFDAFKEAIGRSMYMPWDVEAGRCKEADLQIDLDLCNEAWTIAKVNRFYA